MERNSRKLIKKLTQDGWALIRTSGSHHVFQHPKRDATIVVPHPRKALPVGLVREIYRVAGWL